MATTLDEAIAILRRFVEKKPPYARMYSHDDVQNLAKAAALVVATYDEDRAAAKATRRARDDNASAR